MPYRRIDARLGTRHPFQVFVLVFALVVGIPALLGIAPAPNSIQAALSPWFSFSWSLALAAGSVTALTGIFWRERATGLILEQLGLAGVGGACLVYGTVALFEVGESALVPAGIIIGFALACFAQYHRIQVVLDEVHEIQESLKRERGER